VSLNWDLTKITNMDELCWVENPEHPGVEDEKTMNPVTNSLIWACLSIGMTGITEKNWQKIPADVQQAMIQADKEVTEAILKYQEKETQNIISDFEKGGMTINRLPADEKARWDQKLAPLIDEWVKAKGLPGKQVLDSYKKASGQ